jgi:hypothetical protein
VDGHAQTPEVIHGLVRRELSESCIQLSDSSETCDSPLHGSVNAAQRRPRSGLAAQRGRLRCRSRRCIRHTQSTPRQRQGMVIVRCDEVRPVDKPEILSDAGVWCGHRHFLCGERFHPLHQRVAAATKRWSISAIGGRAVTCLFGPPVRGIGGREDAGAVAEFVKSLLGQLVEVTQVPDMLLRRPRCTWRALDTSSGTADSSFHGADGRTSQPLQDWGEDTDWQRKSPAPVCPLDGLNHVFP